MRAAIHTLLTELHFTGLSQTLDSILDAAEHNGDAPAAVLRRLLREEARYRQERRLAYRLQQARLPWDWSLDTFPCERQKARTPRTSAPSRGWNSSTGPRTWS